MASRDMYLATRAAGGAAGYHHKSSLYNCSAEGEAVPPDGGEGEMVLGGASCTDAA